MHLEPFNEISWAYQLHYHIGFRTHRRRPILSDPYIATAFLKEVEKLSNDNEAHLLETKLESTNVQLVLSLKPTQAIADVMKDIKARSSASLSQTFNFSAPLWARGYLARTLGTTRITQVKHYIANQAEHHGYHTRVLPPVYKFRNPTRTILVTAHSTFDLTHHIVLATKFRRSVFGSQLGNLLVNYWMRVARKHNFGLDQVTVLPDHVHLLIRIIPKTSINAVVLSLMNNGQYFIGRHFSEALINARIDQLWQPSAYTGSCGKLTTALMKAFLTAN